MGTESFPQFRPVNTWLSSMSICAARSPTRRSKQWPQLNGTRWRPGMAAGSPYVGLTHYTEGEAGLFFGRDRDIGVIISNLRGARLTLLYAQSGVGKSSVLRAGVAARLSDVAKREARDQGFAALRARGLQQMERRSRGRTHPGNRLSDRAISPRRLVPRPWRGRSRARLRGSSRCRAGDVARDSGSVRGVPDVQAGERRQRVVRGSTRALRRQPGAPCELPDLDS